MQDEVQRTLKLDVERVVVDEIAKVAGLSAHSIDREAPLTSTGLDSLSLSEVLIAVEDRYEVDLPIEMLEEMGARGEGLTIRQLVDMATEWLPRLAGLQGAADGRDR